MNGRVASGSALSQLPGSQELVVLALRVGHWPSGAGLLPKVAQEGGPLQGTGLEREQRCQPVGELL